MTAVDADVLETPAEAGSKAADDVATVIASGDEKNAVTTVEISALLHEDTRV